MNLLSITGTGLFVLFVVSEICGHILKIKSQKFYMPFHFTGGVLTFLFLNSFIKNLVLSVLFVFIVGVLWEIYEWLRWKYFLKEKMYKPEKGDTLNDLVLDIVGAIVGLGIWKLLH